MLLYVPVMHVQLSCSMFIPLAVLAMGYPLSSDSKLSPKNRNLLLFVPKTQSFVQPQLMIFAGPCFEAGLTPVPCIRLGVVEAILQSVSLPVLQVVSVFCETIL